MQGTQAAPTRQTIAPQPGESYEDYVVRAHLALMQQVPEPAERNAAVWGMWEQTNGDPERERAAERFSADRFERRPMVPLFVEHEKVNYDAVGKEAITRYDVDELKRIIRENNFRIEDSDAYTGLVDRHTVPAGSRDPMPPRTLGYVGPYRLGMLGRKHPRFAIFADEHHRRDRADILADRPRRSVEVLKLRANGRRYIDPIAALAEAPRLPLPVNTYSADTSDTVLERYAAVAPHAGPYGLSGDIDVDLFEGIDGPAGSLPGGSNTFGRKPLKDRNAATEPKDPAMLNNSNPDGLVRQVIDALQSTEEWQALSELVDMMKSGQLGGSPEPVPPPAPGMATGDDPAEVPPMPGEPMPGGPMPGSGGPIALGGQSAAGLMGGEPGEAPMPSAMGADRDRNIAPVLAAAGRAAMTAAARPAVQSGVGRMVGGAIEGMASGSGGNQQQKGAGVDQALSALESLNTRGTTEAMAGGSGQYGASRYMGHHRYAASRGNSLSDEESEMSTDRYAALEADYSDLTERYEALQAELEAVQNHNQSILTEQAEHYAALRHQVVQLQRDKIDSQRRERLTNLANRFPVVDVEEEAERCLYSAGNDMTADQFEAYCDTIERYAAAAAVATPMVPVGVVPRGAAGRDFEADLFEAQAADRAVEIVNDHLRRNERLNYAQAVEMAKAELTGGR